MQLPPIASGPFKPEWNSLTNYQSAPEWFRDAKFGIWAHWGPSSAIGDGDWYARNMYMEGSPQYEYHLKTYGHPSKFGYKDTIPLWKAEAFAPACMQVGVSMPGRTLRPQGPGASVPPGGSEVLRQHGRPLRQLRPVELARPSVELGEDGAEARHSRRVAAGSARGRPPLRSQRARLGELQLVDPPTKAPTSRANTRESITMVQTLPTTICISRRTRLATNPGPSRATKAKHGNANGSCALKT